VELDARRALATVGRVVLPTERGLNARDPARPPSGELPGPLPGDFAVPRQDPIYLLPARQPWILGICPGVPRDAPGSG
jgi:hypothetical protein